VADVASTALESGRSIGRYFAVISMVPSLLFVLYVYGLFAAGAWSGSFEPVRALHAAGKLGISEIVALLVAALVLGLVLHPFQFSMTQLLEGYWGGSGIGLRLARWRILHYRRVVRDLEDRKEDADAAWQDAALDGRATSGQDPGESLQKARLVVDSGRGDSMLADYLRAEAAGIALGRFPLDGRRTMPTRLGNVLRGYEDSAGQQYGLDFLRLAPHFNLVAVKEHREYVDDCRKGLDLGVRMCVLFVIATVLSVVSLISDGAWLLLSLAPYCVSYLAYRGTVSSAKAYGTALSTLIDLNRFALYEQFHLPPPADTKAEKDRNVQLVRMIRNRTPYFLKY
jgi:hypothetical protein